MHAGSDDGFDAESLLRSLMDNIPGAIYRAVNDDTWTVLTVSEEIEAITGHPASWFVDASRLNSVTHPDDLDAVVKQIDDAIAAGRPWVLEYRVVATDGTVRWIHERGVKTVDRDGTEWIDGIMFDISDRRAAEQLRVERELEAVRVAELEASRARIVEAADAARRRIERDLHDGAQQRLVAASLLLRSTQSAAEPGSATAARLQAAREELEGGLEQLRELARGIHPALLTDRGLGPALRALIRHSAVRVQLEDELGERLPQSVETALYYVVSEALTNVDRYAAATHARVTLRRSGDRVEVEVADDGRGGADASRGSGLRGLEDRLGAIGGWLELHSPPAGGTRLRAFAPVGPEAGR
jgi:PAS domain S-box-containing protein